MTLLSLKPTVSIVAPKWVLPPLLEHHYLHRKPPISKAFALTLRGRSPYKPDNLMAVATFGVPASRHLQLSVCPTQPNLVLELNRLWVHDDMPINTASWFIARCLNKDSLQGLLICSYADTSVGHLGYVYRACNWHYAGWTDMDRKTPRFDYVAEGKHSRDAFRNGYTHKVRRKPKVRYWRSSGDKRQKKWLESICGWPKMNWKTQPPPKTTNHDKQKAGRRNE